MLESDELLSPPRNWPKSFQQTAELNTFIGRGRLNGRRCRLVAEPAASVRAMAAGVELVPDDSISNATRLHASLGWDVVKGFAVYELKTQANTFVAQQRWWNINTQGAWVDLTPRPADHGSMVLVESALGAPLPPPAEKKRAEPVPGSGTEEGESEESEESEGESEGESESDEEPDQWRSQRYAQSSSLSMLQQLESWEALAHPRHTLHFQILISSSTCPPLSPAHIHPHPLRTSRSHPPSGPSSLACTTRRTCRRNSAGCGPAIPSRRYTLEPRLRQVRQAASPGLALLCARPAHTLRHPVTPCDTLRHF